MYFVLLDRFSPLYRRGVRFLCFFDLDDAVNYAASRNLALYSPDDFKVVFQANTAGDCL